jgi:predicted ATPase
MEHLTKKLDVVLVISLMVTALVLQVPTVGAVEAAQEAFNFLRDDVVRLDVSKDVVTLRTDTTIQAASSEFTLASLPDESSQQQQPLSMPTQISDNTKQADGLPINLYIIVIGIAIIIPLALKALAIKKRSR